MLRRLPASDHGARHSPQPAALGWRAHSGWAVLVAVAGPLGSPAAVGRWRIELAAGESGGPAQPYHRAAEAAGLDARRTSVPRSGLRAASRSAAAAVASGESPGMSEVAGSAVDLAAAERIVHRAAAAARELARRGLVAATDELRQRGLEVVACGLLLASGRPAPSLAAALSSHAQIHAAEGELFRQAIVQACESLGLPVEAVRERDLPTRAGAGLGLSAGEPQQRAAEMGRPLGPPWRQDEKQAALVAWLALAAFPPHESTPGSR